MHPETAPATRFRVSQYRSHFQTRRIDVRIWSFLRERDLRGWYGKSHRGRVVAVLLGILRLPSAISLILSSDVILIQREAAPLGPALLEKFASLLRPTIWDFDDALWRTFSSPTAGQIPRWLRASRNKYAVIATAADEIWAGSQILADWAGPYNENVLVIPTVVQVPDELPTPPEGGRVGWVGSHSTSPFLRAILPALAGLNSVDSVLAVGAGPMGTTDVFVDQRPWSPSTELEALRGIRVGLYPIDREHPLADGKCGLKAIMYMANGIPPVVTPTPTNAAIVRHGVDGLHANSESEWRSAVSRLLEDRELWHRLRRSGYERAHEHYSVERWAPALCERIVAIAEHGRLRAHS